MKISIVLAALTGSFETDMNRASKTAQKRMKEIEKTAKEVGAVLGTALAAGAVAAAAGIKAAIDRMDELGKSSQKLGVGTEALSKLAYAASLADVEFSQLESALGKLIKSQDAAAQGSQEQLALFQALGVEFKNQDGTLRNVEEVFLDLATAFKGLPDGANKAAAAFVLLGRTGADLIPLMNGGEEGIRGAGDELERFGGEVGPNAAKMAEEFNDNLTRLRAATNGLFQSVAADLLPSLVRLTDELAEGSAKGDGFRSTGQTIAAVLATVAETAYAAYKNIELMVNGLVEMAARAAKLAATAPGAIGIADRLFFGGSLARESGILAESSAAGAAESAADIDRGLGLGRGSFISPLAGGGDGADAAAAAAAEKALAAALEESRGAAERAAAAKAASAAANRAAAQAAREAAALEKAEAKAAEELLKRRHEQMEELQRLAAEERLERQRAKELVDQTLADIAFETKLLGLNNLEREKAIALRYANVDAASAEGQAIGQALEELAAAQDVAAGMDVVRNATEGLFTDLMSGAKSAKDAFMDFVDSILAGIARIVAQKLTEQLFGAMGTTDTGAGGGWLASLFGAFFGGPKAAGGSVYAGKAYLVGEQGPELFMPPGAGNIVPAGATAKAMGGSTVNQIINVTGTVDRRAADRLRIDAANKQRRALSRSF